jgi:hypothetical protein
MERRASLPRPSQQARIATTATSTQDAKQSNAKQQQAEMCLPSPVRKDQGHDESGAAEHCH